ncbi:OmpA family protein [Sinobacterium caligoides]|nr:OmpA family protein [Sinobacterium caligoides]
MKSFTIILCALMLTACMSTDPFTGQQKVSNTAKGAGIGAVSGALLGAALSSDKDRGKGAAIGAAVGGGIGGGVGFSMDKQEAVLRDKLQGSGVQVQREGDNIRLVMPGNITFGSSSYSIRPSFESVLESIVIVVQEFPDTVLRIGGHTDSTGSASLNQKLSEQRADSVGNFLIREHVKAGRVQTKGYGPRYPIASNTTVEGRAQNRRVELQLLPI